jgi:isopenicillin-N epimerase
LRKELWARRVEIPVVERPDRLLLRVSHHFYTTEGEIDRLAEVLREVL